MKKRGILECLAAHMIYENGSVHRYYQYNEIPIMNPLGEQLFKLLINAQKSELIRSPDLAMQHAFPRFPK